MGFPFRRIVAGLGAAAVIAFAGVVAAMTVQPVVVDLRMAGRNTSAPIRVENTGPNPLPVEIRLVETDFSDGGVRASSQVTDDLISFPPQAIIPPGQTQVFRIQYVGDPESARSRHFYAEVAQLPVELPEGQSAIQILYNFQVMVNVASVVAGDPSLSVTSAEIVQNPEGKSVAAFSVANSSGNYGYLSSHPLTIRHLDAQGAELSRHSLSGNEIQQQIGFGLVGPETTRQFVTPLELTSSEGRLEVTLGRRGR
jgi:fimbrial chaperone protein